MRAGVLYGVPVLSCLHLLSGGVGSGCADHSAVMDTELSLRESLSICWSWFYVYD